MKCPVCGRELIARITRPGQAGRPGVFFSCPEDSRHVRGFVNDPAFVKKAQSVKDPATLLVGSLSGEECG